MIDSKELRIGNLVSFKGLWIGEINTISKGSITVKGNEGIFLPENFDPVPLTPERLVEACGFERRDIGYNDFGYKAMLLFDKIDLCLYNDGFIGYNIDYAEGMKAEHVQLEFLHQLQNLYYLLSGGQELPINEDKL